MDYENLIANGKTGDLILFSGVGLIANLIKYCTSRYNTIPISHVGVIYRCPITNHPYIWECGLQSKKEGPIITNKCSPLSAAHLTSLPLKLRAFKGRVFCRILNTVINQHDMDCLVSNNIGTPYDDSFLRKWNRWGNYPILPLHIFTFGDYDNVWTCADLVIYTYLELGILTDNGKAMNHVMPVDFVKDETILPIRHFRNIIEVLK